MREVTKLAASDPALAARLSERDQRARSFEQSGSGKQTEELMRKWPRYRLLVEKAGLKPADLEAVGITVMMTAMGVHMRKQAPEQSPVLKPGTTQAKNFALVEARLPELTRVMAELQRGPRGKASKSGGQDGPANNE